MAEVAGPRYRQTGVPRGRHRGFRSIHPGEALERLGRLSLRELSMEDLLQTVADMARDVMPGNPEASVCLLVRDRPTTIASTGGLATDLDE